MGKTEYIVRFKGDYSVLAKDLNKINAETKKLEDDEVIVKLNYDGNIKEFNKVFDKISKMHPELGIQFQYNVNEKMLNNELDRLKKLTDIKIDIDEGNVQKKIEQLADGVDYALQEGMSKAEITKRLNNLFGYYNTAIKAGAKNIDFYSITDRLYESFEIEADEIKKIYDDIFDKNSEKPIELFHIDKSITEELSNTKERVDDLKDALNKLEQKGASKSGLPSDLQKLQDELKIMRSDIEDMRGQLQNLSGEAFDNMTESIRQTNEQLSEVIDKIRILSMSGTSDFKKKSLQSLMSMFSDFARAHDNKNLSSFWDSLQSKIDAGDESLKQLLVDLKLIDSETNKINIVGHGNVKSGGLLSDKYALLATKEASTQSDNTIKSRLEDTIILKDKLDEAAAAGVNVSRILNIVYDKTSDTMFQLQETAKGAMLGGQGEAPINLEAFEASDEAIQKLISDILYLRKIGVGVDFHGLNVFYDKITDAFSIIDMDLNPAKYDKDWTFADDIIGGLVGSFEDASHKMPEAAKVFVDRVKNILTNIDTSEIEQSAKDATQKAADALQEAQDSNSPAELTKPLGNDFGLGYAEGIREATPEIVAACKEIVLAAYNAIKEASNSEDSQDVNFAEGFIEKFKTSLNEAIPELKNKINEMTSNLSLSLSAQMNLQKFGQHLIEEIGKGIAPEWVKADFVHNISSFIEDCFKQVTLDAIAENLFLDLGSKINTIGEIGLSNFYISFDGVNNLVVGIQDALDKKTFKINIDNTINGLATALNTSVDQVRLSFIDAMRWMRDADTHQKRENDDPGNERVLWLNSKTGAFSNPAIYGNQHSAPWFEDMVRDYKEQGITFDTHLHTHIYDDYAFPSSEGNAHSGGIGDIDIYFKHAFEGFLETVSKFIVGAQKEYAVFDFSKIASNAEEFEEFLTNWVNENLDEIETVIGENTRGMTPREIAGLYVGKKGIQRARKIKASTQSYGLFFENLDNALADMYSEFGEGDNAIIDPVTGERFSGRELFSGQLFDDFMTRYTNHTFHGESADEIYDNLMAGILDEIKSSFDYLTETQASVDSDQIQEVIANSVDKIFSDDYFSDVSDFKKYFYEHIYSYFNGILRYISDYSDDPMSWDEAGSKALRQLSSEDDLIGKVLKYYTPEEFEKEFGKNIIQQNKVLPQSSGFPTVPEDFQNQLQNAIDKSGRYIIKVYGELVDNFKSQLQQSIDDLGVYFVEIKGMLSENFRSDLIKDMESYTDPYYYIEVKGKLIATFREVLQELIDNIGPFPIEVKPYVRKGGEIEEVDLPGGNQTPVSTEPTETKSETKALLSKKEVIEQLRAELNLTKQAAEELFDQQGYTKTNSKYQIEQEAVDALIAALKEKQQVEGQSEKTMPTTSPVSNNIQTEVKAVTEAVEKEKKKFDELKEKISKTIPDAIKKKNEAFKDEAELVSKLISGESEDIGKIKNTVDGVTDAVKDSQKATKDTSVGNNTQNSNTSEKKKKSYQKIRRQSAEKRAAKNAEKKSNIDRLLNEQYDAYKKIWNIRKQIAKLNPNKNAEEISELNNQKDILIKIYAQRTKELKALDETANSEAQNNSLLKLRRDTLAEIAAIEAKRNDKMFSSAESKASDLLKKVDTLRNSGKYTQEFISELNSAEIEISAFLNELKNGSISFNDIDSRIKSLADNVENTLAKKAFGSVKQSAEKSLTNIGLKIDQIIAKNSAMGNEFKSKFNALKTALDSAESIEDVRQIVAEVNRLESEIIRVGKTGNSFIDQIKQRLRDMNSKYIAQYFSFQDILRYARTAITTIIDLDTQLVDLRKTTKMNNTELEAFYKESSNVAKGLGVTTSEIISQAAAWSRLGYNTKEASVRMAELSSQFASISPGMDTEKATDYLVSTMQAYGIAVDDVERKIMDNVNKIGNTFATTNAEIGEMLTRSSAAMKAANNTLEETIALESAAVQITRNAETTGTAFRTVSMRIRGYDENSEDGAEEALENYEELKGKIADLTKTAKTPGGISLFTDANKTEFKSTYQILKDISEIWNDLTDKNRAQLLEALAGKRGGQVLAGVMNDFSQVDKALEKMEDAAGSADTEMEIIRDSIEFKLNAIKQTWVGLLTDVVDREDIKSVLDFIGSISNGLADIVSNLGLVKTALMGVFGFIGARKLNLFDFSQEGGIGRNGLGGFLRDLFSPSDEQKNTDAKGISQLIKFLENGNRTIDDAFNTDELDDVLGNVSDEVADKILEIGTASQDSAKQVSALTAELGKTSKVKAFGSAVLNAGKSLLSSFANGAISAGITWLVSTLAGAAIDAIDKWIHRVEYAEKAINESIDTYKNADNELKNLNQELKDTNDKINELQSKDSLTIVEQDELQTLKETNDELERKIRLKEREKELAAREAIQTIRTESPVALSKVNNYQDRGYEISKTYQREDGSTFIDKQMVNGALEFNAALEDEEHELERIKVLLNGKEFSKDIITNAATGGYETIYHIADATEEQLNLINEEFGSLKNFYDYYQGVEDSVESMRETSKDMVYDLEGELLKVEGWLDTLDDIGYDKLGFDDQKTYESLLQTKEWLQEQVYTQSELFTIKLKVAVDDDELQGNIKKIHTHLLNSGLLDNISDTEKKEIEKWLLGLSEDEAQALADHISQIVPELINGLFGRLDPELLQKVISTYRNKIGYGTLFNNGSSDYGNGTFTTVTLFDDLIAKAKEAKSAIKDVEDATIELQDIVDETKAVDSMAKMENALASLNDLYDQVIKKPDDAGDDTLFGFADPSTINSIESAFEGLIETVDDADAKEKLSYALQDFENTLVEFPGDADKAQYAMDKLLTAYMDQVYGLDNVTDANKEWTIALLKNKGVLNAEEVVESRLDKVSKRLLASEKKLSAVFRDNAKALDDINKGTGEYDKALQDLADEINSMFSFSDGGATFEMNVDTSFVAQNLDLIRQVAAGDAEAIIQLQDLLRAQITGNIDINTNVPQVADMVRNDLYELSQIHLDDIEVGVDISQANANIANLIDSFQKWLDAGLMSVDQINNAFASIGAEPDITETKPVKMTVNSALKTWGLSGSGAAAAQQSMGSATEIVVNMPILKYKKINNGAFSKGLKNINYQKPTTNSNDTGGSGGGGSSDNDKLQEDTKETYDWIEVKLQRLQEAYSRLDKVSGAVYESWHDRNEAVNDSLDITQQQLEAARHAAERYKKERDKFAIDAPKKEDYEDNDKQYEYDLKQYQEFLAGKDEFAEKIKKGLIGEGDIEYISNKYYKEFYDGFKEWDDKYISDFDSVRDLLDQRYDDTKKIFDNIKTQYDGVVGLFESSADSIDKLIERTEEHGFFVSKKYYQQTAKITQDRIEAETHELHELTKARDQAVASGAIKEYSEEWYNMTKEIMDTENEINGLYTELVKLDNQQRQLDWDGFDYAIEKLDKITEETEFLVDLLDNNDLFNFEYDERGHKTYDGTMSDRGWSAAGLHASQYNKELLKSKYATEELAKVEKELATEKGKNDKNLIARREEMLNLQRESIQAAEAEKEAIKDLVSEGIEKHLDMLSQLIEKYKESLTEARDLYDYQKNIASQAKNISSLTKQLSAYSGDDSEEARATIQKLSESLDEAQTNLKETEWDRYISETNDMLDDMFENYSDVLNQRIDDVDALMVYMTGEINARSGDIQKTLYDVADDYAYTITPELQSMFNGNGDLISTFSGNFDDYSSRVITALDNLLDATLELTKGDNVMAMVAKEGLTSGDRKDKHGYWYENADGSYAKNEFRNGYYYNGKGYWNNNEKQAQWKQDDKGWWYQYGGGKYPKNEWLKIDGEWYYFDENGYMVTGERTIGNTKHLFSKNGNWIKEYATGSKNITYDQLAWTQEKGGELIFRSSDGAMLTPLSRGDMVFTNEMSQRLWDLAKTPSMLNTVKLPDSAITARTVNNDNEITLILPNVTNYDEFKNALQKDPKFVNFVQATTIGQALGKGKLNRGNF